MNTVLLSADADPEASDFHHVLQDLVRLQQFRDRERAAVYGVTVSGAHALEVLARLGPLSLNRMAAELFVDKSTASRIVGCLEDRGCLRRVADSRDRRALRLELTPEGREVTAQLADDAAWEVRAMLGVFEPEERAAMLGFLRELTRTGALHAGATGASCCADDPEPVT